MDYVVAGFGIGAILALIGFALWELFGNSDEPGQGWLSRAAIGLMIGSLVIWAVTGVSLVSTVDDSTGSHLVLLTTLVTLVAIAAGTAWYWRADQAMLASMPAHKRVAKPKPAPMATAKASAQPKTNTDVVLTDWDSWPEREAPRPEVSESASEPAVSFEPEVAAVDVSVEPATGSNESPAPPMESSLPEKTDDIVVAVDMGAPTEADEEPADAAAESAAASMDASVAEPIDAPVEPLPKNVRQLRPRPVVEPVKVPGAVAIEAGALASDSAPVKVGADPEPVAEPVEEIATEEMAVEMQTVDGAQVAPAATVAFESSLLADIDVNSVEGDGRYRSPLLADLEANPDELEGVGLAKWRTDARLTAEDPGEPVEKKSRRRR